MSGPLNAIPVVWRAVACEPPSVSNELQRRLQESLRDAMRERDRSRVSVLRTTLTAIGNAEAVDASPSRPALGLYANEVPRRVLSDDDALAIVRAARDEHLAAATEMSGLGRTDVADELAHQAAVLESFLDG